MAFRLNTGFLCTESILSVRKRVNLSMGKAFLVAGSLSSYLTFVFHCLQSTDSDIELDPESYVGYEVDAAKDAGLQAYYPLRKNSETIISHVFD